MTTIIIYLVLITMIYRIIIAWGFVDSPSSDVVCLRLSVVVGCNRTRSI